MNTFRKTNLENIQHIFQEKTGIQAELPRHSRLPLRTAVTMAAVLLCLTATAFAASLFSSLSGDDLGLSATYEGDGIVSIQVENRSDKSLQFQPQLKLMRWSTGEEIPPLSDRITFTGTDFDGHTSGTMTIDLSRAYDMAALEEPLTDDHYYLILTNNHFLFGQDWMCTVSFAKPVQSPAEDPDPLSPGQADEALTAQVLPALQPYFADYVADIDQRRARNTQYLEACQDLLAEVQDKLAAPVSPYLGIGDPDAGVIFDETVPADNQYLLTSLNPASLDGYGLPVGAAAAEQALVLSAIIPQRQGETDGGGTIPLLYLFTYDREDIRSPQDCTFVHGRLLTFAQLEGSKVYADERYVCYDLTDLFYTDLRSHVESMLSQRSDLYFDEQVWKRVENIARYYRDPETLSSKIYYIISPEG